MHGTSEGSGPSIDTNSNVLQTWARNHWRWCLCVLLPTLLTAGYYYLIAANQYESEAHFLVRSADKPESAASGLNQALTMVGGSSSNNDTMLVADYLTSHDVVAELEKRIDLVGIFQRSQADFFSRLWFSSPAPETVLKYYRNKVDVKVSSEDGIATLRVRTFAPKDSVATIDELLALSEARVNEMNRRNYESSVSMARQQVEDAEQVVANIQSQVTNFRRNQGDVSPQATGQARVAMIAQLQTQLAEGRAELAAAGASIRADAPQVTALRSRVTSLAAQIASEQAKIASGPGNVATGLGTFEALKIRQDFAGKNFEMASQALQKAREEAGKQQLFIVRLVNPNVPVKSLYPERAKIIMTVFVVLSLIYGITWLVAAGVKEHSA